MPHELDLTPEEMAQLVRGWRELQHEHDGYRYERVPIKGTKPHGSFTLPHDVVNQLGNGDPKVGGAVVHGMFGVEPLKANDDPTVIDPDVVRDIGHGDPKAGYAVLKKFVARLRARNQERPTGHVIRQPDGHHAYARGGQAKSTKTAVNYRNGTENRRCGLCSMWQPPNGCSAVGGKISPQALCDLYERRKSAA